MSIKVQEGKYYRTRGGDVVGPAKHDGGDSYYPWICAGDIYTNDGSWVEDEYNPQDLISEVTVIDAPPKLEDGKRYCTVKPDGSEGPVVELGEVGWTCPFLRAIAKFAVVSNGTQPKVSYRGDCFSHDTGEILYRITTKYIEPPKPTIVERLKA